MTVQFIFFPFTHITQNHLDTLLAFFPEFHYFPVSADLVHAPRLQKIFELGRIIPVFSSPDELAGINLKVGQYLEWAHLHRTDKLTLKSLLKQTPYFTSDSDVTAIKSRLKGIKKDPEPGESSLQRQLLFLKISQMCDEQNEQIDLALKKIDTGRDELMSNLRGIERSLRETHAPETICQEDLGATMTRERIYAWSKCAAKKEGGRKGPYTPLFVTTSEAVFDYLGSICKDVVNALDIEKIKVHENECENRKEWQYQFCKFLIRAVQADGSRESELPEVNDGCSLSGQIKVKLFSGNDINQLFSCPDTQVPVCLVKLK